MIDKIKQFFNRHPWDWVAHFILGFVVFWINMGVLLLWDGNTFVAVFATVNFLFAVELTQMDVFGVSWSRLIDTAVDLACGWIGVYVGVLIT